MYSNESKFTPRNEMKPKQAIPGVSLGSRGKDFSSLISAVLSKSNFDKKYIDHLTTPEALSVLAGAFTSKAINSHNNYEINEQKGDSTCGKFLVDFCYKHFPQLADPRWQAEGVKIAARIKINYGSKNTFASIAKQLGFEPFISATKDEKATKMKSLLEDTFEAFIGCVESYLDTTLSKYGLGYACVSKILNYVFKNMVNISMKYEDLYDSITRLKETVDMCKNSQSPLVLTNDSSSTELGVVFRIFRNNALLGEAVAETKAEAQQLASEKAIESLKAVGIYKKPPAIYRKIEKNAHVESTTETVFEFLALHGTKEINALLPTRGNKLNAAPYVSTVLCMYAYNQDVEAVKACLKLGANPSIADSLGMNPVEYILMGFDGDDKPRKKLVKKCLKVSPNLVVCSELLKAFEEARN